MVRSMRERVMREAENDRGIGGARERRRGDHAPVVVGVRAREPVSSLIAEGIDRSGDARLISAPAAAAGGGDAQAIAGA